MAVLISTLSLGLQAKPTQRFDGSADEVDWFCSTETQETLHIGWAWHVNDSEHPLSMDFQTITAKQRDVFQAQLKLFHLKRHHVQNIVEQMRQGVL